jgi:septal ring factor EnvC (AmiA/AmiB activator)
MASSTADRDDVQNRLRQQLILAQVRLMEIEDERDAFAAKSAATSHLLAQAQAMADTKIGEAAHLQSTLTALQAHSEHLRHQHHVAQQALAAAHEQLSRVEVSLRNEKEVTTGLQLQLVAHNGTLRELRASNQALLDESAARAARIAELDREQRAMKASRSWRWTAWLRSLERAFSRR